MRRFRLLLAAAALALVPAAGAQAAAPRYILVSGPGIERPIVLANWRQNHAIVLAVASAPLAPADQVPRAGAPRLRLSEFWYRTPMPRPKWPSQTSYHGWIYPADGARPAVITSKANGVRATRIAPARVLRILERAGVPVRG